jgi:uncharacterized protein with GYD domain
MPIFNPIYQHSLLKAENQPKKDLKELKKSTRKLKCLVLSSFNNTPSLGEYDFVNIVEAPNNYAVMRVSIELGSRELCL